MSQRVSAAAASASAAAAPHAAAQPPPSLHDKDTQAAIAAELARVRAIARKDATRLWCYVLPLGVLLRVLLSYVLHVRRLHDVVSARGELTNALLSFAAVKESVSNVQVAGVSPYAGLSCSHAPPLLLAIFTSLIDVPANAASALHGAALFISAPHLVMLACWCVLDVLIAVLLFSLSRDYYARFPSQTIALPWAHALARSNRVVRHLPLWVAGAYMLNPATLTSCVIFNLSHITYLAVVAALLSAARGRPVAAGALLGLSVYLDIYPVLLLLPVMLLVHKGRHFVHADRFPQYRMDKFIRHDQCSFIEEEDALADDAAAGAGGDPLSDASRARAQHQSGFTFKRVLKVVYQPVPLPEGAEFDDVLVDEGEDATDLAKRVPIPSDAALGVVELPSRWDVPLLLTCALSCVGTVVLLLLASFHLSGESWSFLSSSYGYSLRVPSLAPNYGLFWYFFTTLFDRFISFFLVIFHAHLLVYVVPLCVRLRDEPLLLATALLHLGEVFRAYPTLPGIVSGVVLFALVNLPTILPTMRRIYLLAFLNLVSILTQALMRFLWLEGSGGGNANFAYFQHILFMFTHLVCVMEAVGAVRRRQAATLEGQVAETLARRRQARRLAEGSQLQTQQQTDGAEPEESKKHA